MAFADKREYGYWLDQSGNNNDWTSNNLTESDIMVDSPTNNFPTASPIWEWGYTDNTALAGLSQGNLKVNATSNQVQYCKFPMHMTGKVYFEVMPITQQYQVMGFGEEWYGGQSGINNSSAVAAVDGINVYVNQGTEYLTTEVNGTESNTGANGVSIAAQDIIQYAYDADTGKAWLGINNTWHGSGNPAGGSNPVCTFPASTRGGMQPAGSDYGTGHGLVWNFGQDSSFAGYKTAQGNQDGNSIGDFYYTPPTGFLALCTSNLPEPSITPGEHFNTVLYTGDGNSTHAITGVGFQPDMNWIKSRGDTASHTLQDAVRGATATMYPHIVEGENATRAYVASFNTDGFTTGNAAGASKGPSNADGSTYVAWNWKANGSGSSNTNGSINTTATSANTDAGFSISTWTGNATSGASVGHGLSKAPEMMINKQRSGNSNWYVYHKALGATKNLELEVGGAANTTSNIWNDQEPTSSVFYLGNNGSVNGNTETYVTYCFHSVEGYSKVGSYYGNQDADGTFVYCGFKPAWVMLANTTTAGEGFIVFNNKSDPFNVGGTYITAYGATQEQGTSGTASSRSFDFLSNGFKLRGNSTEMNESEDLHVFIAIAETSFKYANGR
jgi:hypothetical protein